MRQTGGSLVMVRLAKVILAWFAGNEDQTQEEQE